MKQLMFDLKAVVGDKISVRDLEYKGTIIGLYVSLKGIQYEIAYFHNGERKTAYLFDSEFSVVEPERY